MEIEVDEETMKRLLKEMDELFDVAWKAMRVDEIIMAEVERDGVSP